MSLMKYLFDHDLLQRGDIEDLRRRSSAAERRSRRQSRNTAKRIDDLEGEVAELALLCRALLTVLHESDVIDAQQFSDVMRRIDAEDGVIDGKITPDDERPRAPQPPIAAPQRSRRNR